MRMRREFQCMKLSLVQPNFQLGPKEYNAYYLPYSVGILWAYLQKFPHIKNHIELDQIIWKRENVDELAVRLSSNNIIAFSTYIWNKSYNYALARAIKQLNPNAVIILGGPEIPHTRQDVFEKLGFCDIIVRSEGELIFKEVIENLLLDKDLKSVKGLVLNINGKPFDTGEAERINDLDEIPSPYLTGVFDNIIKDNKDIEWNFTLETNRGCPYACTFCDWGSLTYNKVKKFHLNRILDELEWAGKNKCGHLTICDANFGMFIERDNIIIDKFLEVQKTYGFPKIINMSWAKNQKAEVFDIIFKLVKQAKLTSGLTVSVQSMDNTVLEKIKRKNLDQHKIESIFELCEKNDVPVYTEVILGLPGETKQSWKEGIYKILAAGNHVGLNFLHAQLLENSEMNLVQKKLDKIKSVPVFDYMSGSYQTDKYPEGVEMVVSTATMPQNDLFDCLIFNWLIQTFHVNGLTTYIARVLNQHLDIPYSKFYNDFYHFLQTKQWFKQEEELLRHYYQNWITIGKINHPSFGKVEIHGWNLIHRTTLKIHTERLHETIFKNIKEFLHSYKLESLLIENLLDFQKLYFIKFDDIKNYPVRKKFAFDFLGFLQSKSALNRAVDVEFSCAEEMNNFDSFLENIYFGRRRNFGKAVITSFHHNL